MNNQPAIFVINLEHSKERRKHIEEQLNNLGLDFEIIKAIDGKNLSENQLKQYSKKEALRVKGRELSTGEIACSLSHLELWKRIVDEDLQKALILEDDAMIGEILKKIIKLENTFPPSWELINFTTDWKLIPFGKPIYDIYRMANIKGISNRSSTYLINKKGAERLLNHAFPIRLPIDDLKGRTKMTGLVIYSIHPQIASFMDFKSDTWSITNRNKLETTFLFKLRRFCKTIIHLLHRFSNHY